MNNPEWTKLEELWDNVPTEDLPDPGGGGTKFRSMVQNGLAEGKTPEEINELIAWYSKYYYKRIFEIIE